MHQITAITVCTNCYTCVEGVHLYKACPNCEETLAWAHSLPEIMREYDELSSDGGESWT